MWGIAMNRVSRCRKVCAVRGFSLCGFFVLALGLVFGSMVVIDAGSRNRR